MKRFVKAVIAGVLSIELFFIGGKGPVTQAFSLLTRKTQLLKDRIIQEKSPLVLEHSKLLFSNARNNDMYLAAHGSHVSHGSHGSHVSHGSHGSHGSHFSSGHSSHYSSTQPSYTPPSPVQLYFVPARQHYIKGEYKEALDVLLKATILVGESNYQFYLGLTYCRLEQYESALGALKRVRQWDGNYKEMVEYAQEQVIEIQNYLDKRKAFVVIGEEDNDLKNRRGVEVARPDEIGIFSEVAGIKIQVFELIIGEESSWKLLSEGVSPLSLPDKRIENSKGILITTEKEGHVRLGLIILPPFKNQYYVPLGEIISKPKLIGEEIIFDDDVP